MARPTTDAGLALPAKATATGGGVGSLFARAFSHRRLPVVVSATAASAVDFGAVFVNPAFERLAGRESKDLLGLSLAELSAAVAAASVRELAFREVIPHCHQESQPRFRITVFEAEEAAEPLSHDSNDAFGSLLEATAAGIIVHRDFQPLYANAASARLLGFVDVDELLTQPLLLPLFPLESWGDTLDRYAVAVSGELPATAAVCRVRTAQGAKAWLELSESPIDWRGEQAVVVTAVEATEHMRAHRSEALLREAIDNLSDSFILYDPDDTVVLTNRRFHEIFSFMPDQQTIAGKPMRELVQASVAQGVVMDPTLAGQTDDKWIDGFIERRRSHKLFLEEDTWPDGRWDLVKEQRLASGGFVSVRTDITDRKRVEFALKAHEIRLESALSERTKYLEAVLANIAQGVIVLDPDLRVVLTNQGLHDIVGYPDELGVPGTHVEALIRHRVEHGLTLPGEPQSNIDAEAIVAKRLQAYRDLTRETFRHPFPNGRLIEIHRQKLADAMIICTFTDVTDQANAEEELKRQREALYEHEKLSALGMLLAGVAHELNNPLTVVLGQTQMIEGKYTDEDLLRRIGQVRVAAQRCAKIVKTFLAMARNEAASRAPVNLNDLVSQGLDLIGYQLRSGDIDVVTELEADLPEIMGDSDQLNQVVVNLLINASQAVKESQGPRQLIIKTDHLAAYDEVELEVSDSGPGVPESVRRRIFEPFFTTKPAGSGTGVGLSVCHSMITAHGGSIKVDDAPRGGARFRVRLPITTVVSVLKTAKLPTRQEPTTGRVLVIDDQPEICEMLAEFLGQTGLSVDAVVSGREALQRFDEYDYDAVICDLRMPAMDGPALYAEVKRTRPQLLQRFIFATGDLLSESGRQFLRSCGRPCLEKPFIPDQVRRLVIQIATGQNS